MSKLYQGRHTPSAWLHYKTRAYIAQRLFEAGLIDRQLEGHEVGNVSNFHARVIDPKDDNAYVWIRPDARGRGSRERAIPVLATTLESWLAEKPNDYVPLKGTDE